MPHYQAHSTHKITQNIRQLHLSLSHTPSRSILPPKLLLHLWLSILHRLSLLPLQQGIISYKREYILLLYVISTTSNNNCIVFIDICTDFTPFLTLVVATSEEDTADTTKRRDVYKFKNTVRYICEIII